MKLPLRLYALCALFSLALPGCGGGGNGDNGRAAPLAVYVTDSFRDDYDHVWVTIYKVEVVDASGTADVVFDDSNGVVIDLRTLRDASGQRFQFLSGASVRSAQHNRVRVTIGPEVSLVPRGGSGAQSIQVDTTVPRDSQNRPVLEFPLLNPRNLGAGNDDLVIDFDLENFTIVNGRVRPSLKEGPRGNLSNRNRHDRNHHSGVVSNLSGDASTGFTFTLNSGGNRSFTVTTDANTRIFNENGAPNPVLQNGRRVKVFGSFDSAARVFRAAAVRINTPENENEAEVRGQASAINGTTGTFVVNTTQVEGFVPTGPTVNVTTAESTVFRADSGLLISRTDFFQSLTSGMIVEVEGIFNASTNTIAAIKAKIEDGDDEQGEVEARGTATNVSAAAGTFAISPVVEWEGFVLSGTSLNVVTVPATSFRDANGNAMTRAAFFTAIASGAQVKVKGLFTAGTFTAIEARLR